MSKALRLSEKWFHRGLWLVAIVFAGFLIGLGGTLVGDLPQVERPPALEDHLDTAAAAPLRTTLQQAERARQDAQAALEQAGLQHQAARSASAAARDTFQNWVATRRATQLPEQDAELLARTRELDRLKAAERVAQARVEAQQQAELDARQAAARARQALDRLEQGARERLEAATRAQELRVFGYRLALTLPLLGLALWLFVKQRRSTWWPFVWGFIYFALFTFFVELVPYLPSYGGYVRYLVGLVLTVVVGRQAVLALQRYLERQRQAEQLPDARRREGLAYDTALARLAKGVCPGCERAVDLKGAGLDYCPHCGIGLHDRCGHCGTRKSAFARFCQTCGATAQPEPSGPGA